MESPGPGSAAGVQGGWGAVGPPTQACWALLGCLALPVSFILHPAPGHVAAQAASGLRGFHGHVRGKDNLQSPSIHSEGWGDRTLIMFPHSGAQHTQSPAAGPAGVRV